MDRRGKDDQKGLFLTALIAALIGIGAQKNVAKGYANDYVKTHAISAQHTVAQHVDDAVKQIASQVSDSLCQETKTLEGYVSDYISMFSAEPYLGHPIGELSLFDQVREIKHRIQVLNEAISSRIPITGEPEQKMGAGLPPPIFCTGSNHCAIASMLSLISFVCILLGYTGNAPPRSFSIVLGDSFKRSVKIRQDQCIVIENIFANLQIFLRLLGEQFPPYAPFLDHIFSLFSSKTFSKNHDGKCSPQKGSKEVISSLKMLEESIESLGDRLQHALLSCGSEQVHSHLQMNPRFISAFGLPCASLDIDVSTSVVRGLLPQIPFTAESMASFQLFGKTVGSDLQFDIKSNLFAAICDTRGRNQNFGAEDAQNVGTSHYYLLIRTGDYRYFFVDSSRTNVQEISQDGFLQNVNENGIVIFMRNSVEQEVPQQVAKISSQSPPSVRKPSTGGGAAAVPAPAALPCRKHSASGGTAAVPHQAPPSFGHAQSQAVAGPQSWQDKLQQLFQSLDISVLAKHIVRPSGQYKTTDSDLQNQLCLLSSVAFDALRTFERISSVFLYYAPNITHLDFTTAHNIVTSFKIGEQMFRCTAVVFKDGHVVAFPELKNLQKGDPNRDQQRKKFYSAIESHFQKNQRVVIDKMLLEPCV